MDSVNFDGVEYVKAKTLAKRFRYTSDYLGQLCRAKKVDARLVGRSWFVNVDSLEEHRRGKYKTTPIQKLEESDIASEIYVERKLIPPVIQNKTFKTMIGKVSSLSPDPLAHTKRLRVSYERDESNLLPTIIKKATPPPKIIRIEQVEAKKIAINREGERTTNFKATALPEIALEGHLKVTEFLDPEQIDASTAKPIQEDDKPQISEITDIKAFKNNDISDRRTTKIKPKGEPVDQHKIVLQQKNSEVSSPIKSVNTGHKLAVRETDGSTGLERLSESNVNIRRDKITDELDTSARKSIVKNYRYENIEKSKARRSAGHGWFYWSFFIAATFGAGLVVIGSGLEWSVSEESSNSKIFFDFSNVLKFISIYFNISF
jgi:hypothetical protein